MNLDSWTPYYKIDPIEKRLVRSNMLYTPLINPEGNIFCMNWDSKNEYQLKHGARDKFDTLINFFFDREIQNLEAIGVHKWSPEIVEIDLNRKQIFFKWYGETCNNIVYSDRDINVECNDWQEQLSNVITDIFNIGYYKPSLYPHCFYIDNTGILHTFDFYACIPKARPLVEFDLIKGMVGPNSITRFKEAMIDDKVNVEVLFKRALEHYIKWPGDDTLLKVYHQLFPKYL